MGLTQININSRNIVNVDLDIRDTSNLVSNGAVYEEITDMLYFLDNHFENTDIIAADESIEFESDDTIVGKIDNNGLDFVNIKKNGKDVITEDDYNGETISTEDIDEEIIIGNSENDWDIRIKDHQIFTKKAIISENDETNINAATLRTIIENLDLSDFQILGNVVCIGDSTVAGYLNNTRVSSFLNITGTLTDISTPGDTISGQKNKWQNLSSTIRANVNFVFIEIGLNDSSLEDTIRYENYQKLILTIRNDAPNAKIILCTMSPALQRFKDLFPDMWNVKFNNWLETNNSIKNLLFYGADTSVWFHTLLLSDSDGNLLPQYEYSSPDHIHPNVAGVKIIAWSWLTAIYKN